MRNDFHGAHLNFLRRAAFIGAVLSLGCADSTAPSWPVTGTWIHDYQIPGMGFGMTLSTNAGVVSGTGTWSGEACCSGTVSVTGTITDGLLELDITETATAGSLIPPIVSHFEGRASRDVLSGTLTVNGQSTPYSYQRMTPTMTATK